MATITRTFTESTLYNEATTKATHVLTFVGTDVIASTDVTGWTLTLYDKINTKANSRNRGTPNTYIIYYYNGNEYIGSADPIGHNALPYTANTQFLIGSSSCGGVKTSKLFNENNSTTRATTVDAVFPHGISYETNTYTNGAYYSKGYGQTADNYRLPLIMVTLDAPPTMNTPVISYNRKYQNKLYTNFSEISVQISNIQAQYGGYIKEINADLGGGILFKGIYTEEVQPPSNLIFGPASFIKAGTFVPTITITDSRDQTYIWKGDSIEILPYNINVSNVDIKRIDANTFKFSEDGINAVLSANFNFLYISNQSYLEKPIVYYGNSDITDNITWYANWTPTNGFSNELSNNSWATIDTNTTLYAKISSTLSTNNTHSFSISPRTNITNGDEVQISLPQAFYLLAGRPGGHGLGIGVKPPGDNLYIDMDIFLNTSNERTTDVNLLSVIHSLNWDSGSSTVIE